MSSRQKRTRPVSMITLDSNGEDRAKKNSFENTEIINEKSSDVEHLKRVEKEEEDDEIILIEKDKHEPSCSRYLI
jgi:hypothetical protein